MAEREINRFVVVPPADTPSHLVAAHIFDAEDKARKFAEQINGRLFPAIDVDAVIEHQERPGL